MNVAWHSWNVNRKCAQCGREDGPTNQSTGLCWRCTFPPQRQVFLCQYFADVGAVEASSKEEALVLMRGKHVLHGSCLNPHDVYDIETVEEFIERALCYWR